MLAIGFVSSQRHAVRTTASVSIDSIEHKITIIRNFDVYRWAKSIGKSYIAKDPDALTKLVRIGSIWQAAGLIYAKRVLHTFSPNSKVDTDTISSLSAQINVFEFDNDVLKCFLWPIFIVGAESETREQRDWSLKMLDRIWCINFCANAANAAKVLKGVWEKEDSFELRTNTYQYAKFDWIAELSAMEDRWMFF
jgi:hypothetical protein